MNRKITFLLALLFWGCASRVTAQTSYCPSNIDFELGTTANWIFYTGYYHGSTTTMTWTPTPAIATWHTLTSGAGTDPYGFFPVVGDGSYSLQLQDTTAGQRAARATYTLTVPTTPGIWSIVYRYAVVLENPPHAPSYEPKMTLTAYVTSSGVTIPCTSYTYVASSSLPGFSLSPGTSSIFTKPWTYGNMKFPGLGGQAVTIDFSAYDCSLGTHFGYCYIDMSCGFFATTSLACGAGTATLSGPAGFQYYSWYDSLTFTTFYGSGSVVSVTTPTVTTTYALIITPYAGYGCQDTLYTTVIPGMITSHAATLSGSIPDTTICSGGGAPLSAHAVSPSMPITYVWTPAAGLSCTTCYDPVAMPTASVTYSVTATNAAGCAATSTVTVNVISCSTTNVQTVPGPNPVLRVYPNPSAGVFTVLLSTGTTNENVLVSIVNSAGEEIKSVKTVTNKATEVRLNASAGIYFVKVSTGRDQYQAKVTVE